MFAGGSRSEFLESALGLYNVSLHDNEAAAGCCCLQESLPQALGFHTLCSSVSDHERSTSGAK